MPEPLSPEQLDQIHNDLFAGRKINAIKLYREATNVGLKEAKDAVEAMADELYQRSPERFTRDPKAKGYGRDVRDDRLGRCCDDHLDLLTHPPLGVLLLRSI